MRLLFILLTFFYFLSGCTSNTEVDLIVHNAKIYTVDSTFTTAEAFAVKNGIFIDIGTSRHILKRYKAKEVIDAKQKAVYPGFYDSHVHSFLYANLLQEADLTGTKSFAELIKRLQDYQRHTNNRKWIIGNGWDQNLWEDKSIPTKDSLDKYFPNIPVFLTRVDYHSAIANSEALRIAQIDSARMVEGGLIEADEHGLPTGLLVDNAVALVTKYIPVSKEANLLAELRQAQDSLFKVGLTSIVDAGLTEDQLETLKKFYQQDSLKIRNYAMIFAEPHSIEKHLREGQYESDRLTIKGVKMLADGALGSRGAKLLSPYNDSPSQGFFLHSPQEFDETLAKLAKSDFQVSIHAIGDSANRLILDLYGKHLTNNKARRWRLEHAQILHPLDFAKIEQYQIIPSIQPTHATSDMKWLADRIGTERMKDAYAYKKLLKRYGKIAIGTDFPVEAINPLYSFHAAVARVDANGSPSGGFQMENALTRQEALRGMTIWAAYACFQEKKRGSIEKGKDADFVILDEDIMVADDSRLRHITNLRTVIAGETVYKK